MIHHASKVIHRCHCEPCQRHPYSALAKDHQAINRLLLRLDEKSRRRVIGLLAAQQKRGGLETFHQITGLSRTTIRRGRTEVLRGDHSLRVRRVGGGRKALEKKP
jgi:hypothetical protein